MKYMVYVYGAYLRKRYGGHLVEIKVIAQSRSEARTIVRGMIENSPHIDVDEGLLLNDEYEYR
ncbi:MAG: hypothetical protein J6S14_11815 [Clostridia bacterium]|nr:hypothetical protein [Clostridia bacterium]